MDNRLAQQGLIELGSGELPEEGLKRDYFSAHGGDLAYFQRRAQRARSEAIAQLFASVAGGLKALWGRIDRARSAKAQSLRAARELRGLGDRGLGDIGLRRDQIDCVTQRVPC